MEDGVDPFGMGMDPMGDMGMDPDGMMPEDFDEFGGRGAAFFSDDGVEQFQPPVAFDLGDGTKAMAWEDGMSQTIQDDGSFTVFWGDGKAMERVVNEEGGFQQINPDGTIIEQNADGSGRFTSITGEVTITEVQDDGSSLTISEDGASVLKRPDG